MSGLVTGGAGFIGSIFFVLDGVRVGSTAEFLYKTTDYYSPEHQLSISWSDSTIAIRWPIDREPALSVKDGQGKPLFDAEHFA